jgi:mannose-6-phosphate isomerase-like protein (cupin superfamily)
VALIQEADVHLKGLVVVIAAVGIFHSFALVAQGPRPAPDPATPIFWSLSQMKEIDARLASNQNATTHNAATRLIGSANAIYRTGASQSEIHEKQGEIIFIRDGEGVILVGGKMVGGKLDRPDELRGDSIDGGTRYNVTTGDTLYVPVNMPHQFFVDSGKHIAITIVKLNPLP